MSTLGDLGRISAILADLIESCSEFHVADEGRTKDLMEAIERDARKRHGEVIDEIRILYRAGEY